MLYVNQASCFNFTDCSFLTSSTHQAGGAYLGEYLGAYLGAYLELWHPGFCTGAYSLLATSLGQATP